MSSGNRVPPALTQPVLSTGPMINDAIRKACFAGRIANPRQRCWARPRGPAAGAYPQHGSGTAQPGSYHSAGLIGQTREFSATMGSMSASDAAPLPRLGEVFFDVRGDSRSMRLSWYADTGVAVFSIWQGGTCTGTFRLPRDDLARMIEALRRGPQGQRAGRREAPGEAGPEGSPAGGGPAGRGPQEGQATVAMRMPAGSGAPPGQRPDGPRPEPGYPAGAPGDYGTGPGRTYRGDSGGYPVDPLDPAYPVPGGRYQDEPSTGSYRGPAQEYDTGTGYPADPDYQDGPGPGDYRRGAATGYPDVPATGDYRAAQSGSHRRDPGDFPGEPRQPRYPAEPAAAEYRDDDDHGAYHDPGYPDVPGTGDYRTAQSGSHRRPAGGYPDDPSFHPYSGQAGIADYPGEAPADDSGAYPAGPDYGESSEWDDTADHSVEDYGSEPEESFPYGPPPGNHDRRERGRYPGRH